MKPTRRYFRHFLKKSEKKPNYGGRGLFPSRILRKQAAWMILVLLILLPSQASYAKRTVYVMSGNAGSSASAETGKNSDSLKPKAILDSMTLEQKIAQMLMPSVRDEDGGGRDLTELTPVAQEAIEKYSFCGYLFFSRNCQSIEQMTRLTSSMQRAAVGKKSGLRIPLFLAIDQEGGRIERIGSGTLTPGNMALAATMDAKTTREAARIIGSEMRSAGFNTDCAPVMDVNSNPENPVINLRSFGSQPAAVADMGTAFFTGLSDSGVTAIMKHFPGHGDTATDSHSGLPIINKTIEELEEQELVPFQAGIDAGADMIMTAHIEFPNIEKDTYPSISTGKQISLPATLSDDILTGLLRGKMGFDGVIITDAIKMDAIRKHFDPVDAAELAINAGVDIILNPGDITTEQHVAALEQFIHQIAARVEKGSISEATIDDAVLRILKLKEKNGLLRETDRWQTLTSQELDAKVEAAGGSIGSQEHKKTVRQITERSTTLLKNENQALPVKTGKTVILCPEKAAVDSVEAVLEEMKQEGILKTTADVTVVSCAGLYAASAAPYVAGAENVIAVFAGQSPSSIGKSASAMFLRTAAAAVHKSGGNFILICGFLPYDAAAFPDADAILLSYGYKTVTEIPEDQAGEEPDYGPNLPAAVRAAFGAFIPSGSVPVDIPEMDAGYHYTDRILYPAGYGIQDWGKEKVTERISVSSSLSDEADKDSNNKGKSEKSTKKSRDSVLPVSPLECGMAVWMAIKYLFL